LCVMGVAAQDWGRRRRSSPSGPACPSKDFKSCLQTKIDSVAASYASEYPNLALQVAIHSATDSFSVASGSVNGRKITVDDKFTYGSGTKPVTATAIMRLIDGGKIKGSDKAHTIIDPYLQKYNGTTLAGIFGDAINNATALDLVRMSAGIPDFEETSTFDATVLESGKFLDYPLAAMHSVESAGMLCDPNSCSAYSSTSYEVAGLFLAALLSPNKPWYEFDLGDAALPDRSQYPSLLFPPRGTTTGKLSDSMTVPGIVTSYRFGGSNTYYDQSDSTLGWTCGNMVGSASDVAKFFYDLLDSNSKTPIVSDSSRQEMTTFQLLSKGWFAGHLRYGTGLMQRTAEGSTEVGDDSQLGYDIGHDGETYGFSSRQGHLAALGISYSAATNIDKSGPANAMSCHVHQIAIELLSNTTSNLNCDSTVVAV
jgi:hypothetical protein